MLKGSSQDTDILHSQLKIKNCPQFDKEKKTWDKIKGKQKSFLQFWHKAWQ